MSTIPIPCVFLAGHFTPLPAYKRLAAQAFGDGEIVTLTAVEERSPQSHNHYFACVHSAWVNLPEDIAERFASEDHLRKWALIKAGYRDERTTVCASKAEAERMAAFIRPLDDYAIVVSHEATVIVMTAKSQSLRAMGKEEFQASKEAVLHVLSDLIGVDVADLHNAS